MLSKQIQWMHNFLVSFTCTHTPTKSGISSLFSRLLHALRYINEYLCELLGNIILSASLVWGFVASLAIILLINSFPV